MPKRILVMGLPGAGKTYLAQHIVDHLQADKKRVGWLNADDVRKKYNDWDFSTEGRIRQSHRMRELADSMTDVDYVICDFVAPLVEMRNNFKAHAISHFLSESRSDLIEYRRILQQTHLKIVLARESF